MTYFSNTAIGLILSLLIITSGSLEGKPSYQSISINLTGKTTPLKEKILDNRVTISLKDEGSGKIIYEKKITVRAQNTRLGNIFLFSLDARVRSGSNKVLPVSN